MGLGLTGKLGCVWVGAWVGAWVHGGGDYVWRVLLSIRDGHFKGPS